MTPSFLIWNTEKYDQIFLPGLFEHLELLLMDF